MCLSSGVHKVPNEFENMLETLPDNLTRIDVLRSVRPGASFPPDNL